MIFLTIYKNAVIVLNALVAVVSGNRMGFRSSLTRIFPLLSHSVTFTEHQLCAWCRIRCWDTVVTKTQSPPWGTLTLSFNEYAKLDLYSKKERKLWEHGIAGDLGVDRALQPQAKGSERNHETWKEMRMGVIWRNGKNQHFYSSWAILQGASAMQKDLGWSSMSFWPGLFLF